MQNANFKHQFLNDLSALLLESNDEMLMVQYLALLKRHFREANFHFVNEHEGKARAYWPISFGDKANGGIEYDGFLSNDDCELAGHASKIVAAFLQKQNKPALGREAALENEQTEIKKSKASGLLKKRKAERRLHHIQDRLYLSLEVNKASVYEVHYRTRKAVFTPQLFKSLAYTAEALPDSIDAFHALIHPNDLKMIHEKMEAYFKEKADSFYCEYRMRSREGEWRWVNEHGRTVKYNEANQPLVMIGIVRDVHERVMARRSIVEQNKQIARQYDALSALNKELHRRLDEIRQINSELKQAMEKAMESDQLKSAFLANMSHEIRTPLNSILGFSYILASGELGFEEQQKYARLIENGGSHLLRIIDDIVDISKLESKQMKISRNRFDVVQLLGSLERTMKEERKKKQKTSIEIVSTSKGYAELMLYTDQTRLNQVFINLLNNALKFTERGRIVFGIEKAEEETVSFFVSDTGSGIDKENFEAIFERFNQLDERAQREGTGLGLSITRGILSLLGGEISINSEKGKGSTFRFSIPFTVSAPD
ncbi:PAS domain S-box-containing protein [Roseimarinus sediminis]